MTTRHRNLIAGGLIAGGFVLVYWDVIAKLVMA
jgi:hypothetical protein